jgi:integrase/recombinase XerD
MSFSNFIRERQFLHNVTPATVEWYKQSFRWLPCENPTQEQLNEVVMVMRERGLRATGCNCVFRAVNAYLRWSGSANKFRLIKEPHTVLPTYTEAQIRKLIAWRPNSKHHRRLHVLVLFLLDTGCRINEALSVRVREVDFENLLVTLDGKGRKQRVVPFSFELRKAVFRHVKDWATGEDQLLFSSQTRTKLGNRVMLRDVKLLCKRLGFTAPARSLHAFRHTFALNYLRRGGSVFHLQKVLGHSSLDMTRRYANLVTADLQSVHERVSLLSK